MTSELDILMRFVYVGVVTIVCIGYDTRCGRAGMCFELLPTTAVAIFIFTWYALICKIRYTKMIILCSLIPLTIIAIVQNLFPSSTRYLRGMYSLSTCVITITSIINDAYTKYTSDEDQRCRLPE